MLKRFLVFVVLGSLALALGVLFYLNPGVVELHLTPSRAYSLPLPLLVLASALAGASAIFALALVREAQWTLSDRRRRRREAKREKAHELVSAGRDLLWHGRPGPANRLLRRAPASQRDVESLVMLAETALAAGRGDEARSVLEDALSLHTDHPRLLVLRASISAREHEWREATALLERAAAREPESVRLAAALRDAYVRERRWREAVAAEDRYLTLVRSPDDVDVEQRRFLGLRYEAAVDREAPEDSLRELREVLRRDPGFVPAAVALGDALRQLDRHREAGRVWLRTARIRPAPVLLDRIESLYRELGRAKKVSMLYARLRRDGDTPLLVERTVRFFLAEGSVDEAAATLAAAKGTFTDERRSELLRGEIERRRGNAAAALEALHAVFDAGPGEATDHVCAACGRASLGWSPRCPACGQWDSVEPRDAAPAGATNEKRGGSLLRRLMWA